MAEIIHDYGIDCGVALGIGVHKIIKEQIGNSLGETERVAMLLRQKELWGFWGFTLWDYGEKTNFDDEGIFNSVYYKVKPNLHEELVRAALSTYEVAIRVCPQELRAIILEKSGIGFGNGRVYEKILYKRRKKKIASWSEKDREDISREKNRKRN